MRHPPFSKLPGASAPLTPLFASFPRRSAQSQSTSTSRFNFHLRSPSSLPCLSSSRRLLCLSPPQRLPLRLPRSPVSSLSSLSSVSSVSSASRGSFSLSAFTGGFSVSVSSSSAQAGSSPVCASSLDVEFCFAGRRPFSKRSGKTGENSQETPVSDSLPSPLSSSSLSSSLPPQTAQDVMASLVQAGRFPKASSTETEAPGSRRARRLRGVLLLLACTCLPVAAAAAIFKAAITFRTQEVEEALHALKDEDTVLRAAMDVVSGGSLCFCLPVDSDGAVEQTALLEPHLPESRLLKLPDKDVIAGIRNNSLTDLFVGKLSEFSLPFNFIHFALPRSGTLYKKLVAHPKQEKNSSSKTPTLSLLYVQRSSGSSVLLSGFAVAISAPEYRRHYWRNVWSMAIPEGEKSQEYVLLKFVPVSLQLHLPAACGSPQAGPEGAVTLRRFVSDSEVKWVFSSPPQAS
ncbi:UNVERIFIED_CONTAM: hypothetical protein HHA_230910 [Hammondia hammondi]|eukprot:XP_008885743.1 hypothetical protein HHA_230910 [Hammondia hammondi]